MRFILTNEIKLSTWTQNESSFSKTFYLSEYPHVENNRSPFYCSSSQSVASEWHSQKCELCTFLLAYKHCGEQLMIQLMHLYIWEFLFFLFRYPNPIMRNYLTINNLQMVNNTWWSWRLIVFIGVFAFFLKCTKGPSGQLPPPTSWESAYAK